MTDTSGRTRREGRVNRAPVEHFVNPFPQMSEPEARVFLFLRGISVPFSWRSFDGQASAPNFIQQMPDFVPEFTLSEYKSVILVLGSYWGTLPGIMDKNALAAAILEFDGWKVALLWENDIRADVARSVLNALPELANPSVRGGPKNVPEAYDKAYMERRRAFLAAAMFKRRKGLREGNWSERIRRSPKRGDRRNPTGIQLEPTVEDFSMFGTSRLNGRMFGRPKNPRGYGRSYHQPLYKRDKPK